MTDDPQTQVLSDLRLARLRERRKRAAPARLALTLFHHDGIQVVPLVEGSPLVIGRFPPSDVVLRDESLSRQHARVEVADGVAWVEDLGSTNGTLVDGERIERAPLPGGAEVAFGAVSGVVHALDAGVGEAESHDRFVASVHREVARARAFGRSLVVLMIRPAQASSSARWIPHVTRSVRPFDTMGSYCNDTVELLRPESSEAEARALATALVAGSEPLRVGLAVYPDHARTAEALIACARTSLLEASKSRPVAAAQAVVVDERDGEQQGPVFENPAMRQLAQTAARLADSVIPVLITGETGTGKEVFAGLVGRSGRRKGQPMVVVNCAGIPATLLESTLFGHVKGAFTGATEAHAGLFEAADGGTIFLDEVGELPAPAQAALLRVLETGRFQRVGATKEVAVDVRVVAATHRDLEAMSEAGNFRRDLVYRLNAMTLEIPALRDRRDEIPSLVAVFLALANEANGREVKGVSPEAMEALVAHDWPGNVRELKNAVERAVVIAYQDEITVDDLPRRVSAGALVPAPARNVFTGQSAEAGGAGDLRDDLARYEAARIREVLDQVGWRREAAADRLGLPVRTLFRKMRQYGLGEG